jgi:O-antigen/teichoic acid export membrane protein
MSLLADRSNGKPLLFRADSVGVSLSLYLPATVFSRFMGLVRGVALAWLMTESQYGLLQVALFAVNILHPLLGVGLYETMCRYVPQYETRHALRVFLARAVPMGLLIGLALSGLAWLAAAPLAQFLLGKMPDAPGRPIEADLVALGRLAVGAAFCLILYFLILGILRGLRMFRAISVIETVYQVGFTVAAVVVAVYGFKSTRAMLICYAVSVLTVALVSIPWLIRAVAAASDQRQPLPEIGEGRSLLEQMLRFGVWAALAAVVWQTLQYYPMWYLHKVCPQQGEATAVFAGVRMLAQAVLVVSAAIVAVVQTWVTKTWEAEGPERADRRLLLAFKATSLLLLAMSAVLAVSARLLVKIYPASYGVGAVIIPPSLLNYMIFQHLLFLAIHFSLIERTRHVFLPWCLGLMCSVVSSKWLVQPNLATESALSAAAWAGVLGITPALVVCVILLKAEKRPFDFGTWLLLAVTYALGLPIAFMLPIVAAVLLLGVTTTAILHHDEKQQIRDFLAAGGGKARQILSQFVGWM